METRQRDVAVVTGGGSGIGRESAAYLLEQGWVVHTLDVGGSAPDGATHHIVDVTMAESMEEAAQAIGPLDALVTAAGINLRPADGPAHRLELSAWQRTLDVNLTGTMLSVRAFYPQMRDNGSIVTVSSAAGIAAMPWADAYTASKGGVVALTKAWAIDYSRYGVRVNCVCPGTTQTEMMEKVLDAFPAGAEIPLPQQRSATPREVAAVIGFLCSREATYLSGAIIPVDGGATANVGGMPFPLRRQRQA